MTHGRSSGNRNIGPAEPVRTAADVSNGNSTPSTPADAATKLAFRSCTYPSNSR
jgi:hypothetical protein